MTYDRVCVDGPGPVLDDIARPADNSALNDSLLCIPDKGRPVRLEHNEISLNVLPCRKRDTSELSANKSIREAPNAE
ncbi:hypothetical protein PUN28_003828 [Cardiocondyla obscurior]|uniref:Uncharacterized protein n=1 Tax=Cardiocondyla obscurior TaxID=286306 RepID=A0AAW2GKH5_9HYME